MIDRVGAKEFSSQFRTSTAHEETKPQQLELKQESNGEKTDNSPTKEKVEDIVQGLNEFITPLNTSLKFEFHEKLKEYYVKIIDEKTEEVVREIPSKKLLDIYAAMTEYLGLMVDKKI